MLEAALRGLSVGSDTHVYAQQFDQIKYISWDTIFEQFVDRYIHPGADEYDIGYNILQKLVSYVTSSFHVFTFIAQLTFFVPLGVFLYRYSKDITQLIFSFVLYTSLMHIIALSGGRQLYAIGFCIMFFMAYLDRKYVRCVVCLLIAVTLHMSALLILLPIAIDRLSPKLEKLVHLIALLLFPVVLLFVNPIILFMGNLVGSEKYAAYGQGEIMGGATTFILLIILLSLFCFIAIKKKDLASDRFLKSLYCMAPCFTFAGPLIYSNGSMIRVSMYFHLYLILLIPYAIDLLFNRKSRKFVYMIVIGALLFLSLKDGGLKYYFFWNDPIYMNY